MTPIYIIRQTDEYGNVTFFAHGYGDKKATSWLDRGGWSHAEAMTLSSDEAGMVIERFRLWDIECIRVA